jgi:glycosyltransferase involved in cell wall biosynthesis
VTCSAYVASQFPGILSTVIPSGADLLSLSRVDTSEPLTRDPTTVVCVGRLNRWKGQDVLVRAIGELRDQGRTVRCQLVGGAFVTDQEVERNLVQLVDGMGLGDQVELLGDLADPSVVVANADIAVVPSKVAEPFGKVVVEAMALGRPIVATAAGGPLEVINDELNGLLVPPDDAVALAKAIARYLDDPVWARGLGRAARVRAQDFDERDAATAYRVEMERLAACP